MLLLLDWPDVRMCRFAGRCCDDSWHQFLAEATETNVRACLSRKTEFYSDKIVTDLKAI
jgi:hypothetical protein